MTAETHENLVYGGDITLTEKETNPKNIAESLAFVSNVVKRIMRENGVCKSMEIKFAHGCGCAGGSGIGWRMYYDR